MAGKIIIYDQTHFNGPSREVTGNVPWLRSIGFDNRIESIKVVDSVWVAYEQPDYQGRQWVLEEGEYPTKESWQGIYNKLSSLKRLYLDEGETPQITVFEHPDYKGKAANFTHGIVHLRWYGLDNKISSVRVKSGIWILYEHPNYTGRQFVVTEGFYPNPEAYRGWHDNISSLRPVKEPYIPTEVLNMDFDIAAAVLSTTPTALVNLSQRNDTTLDQTASWNAKRTLTTTRTYEWHWENSTAIGADYTFKTGAPGIFENSVKIGVTNTFTIGQNRGEENTQSDEWQVNLPVMVKAGTWLRVKVIIQEGKIDVPFTAVLKKGNRHWEEKGTFKGAQSFNLHVDYKETPL